MADHDLHRQRRLFFKRLPKRTAGAVTLIIVFCIGVGATVGRLPTDATLRLFLSALAGAQASLIGIVFAVTILGIQLVSDRYSIRLARLFYRHPVFLLTLVLFLSSIALDLWLMFTLGAAETPAYRASVYAAIGLAVGNGISLVTFVRTALDLNTPEGIIETYSESITPEYFVTWGRTEDDVSSPPHPLYDLHLMAIEAFKHDDLETADKAIDGYGQLAVSLLESILDRNLLGENENPIRDLTDLYEEVFREHLPGIVMHADESGENTLVSKSIEWQYRIGRTGLKAGQPLLAEDALRGLVWMATRDVPVEMDHFAVHSGVWNRAGEFIKDTARIAEPGQVSSMLVQTNSLERRHLGYAFDPDIHQQLVTDYLSDLQDAHETVLERHEAELNESDFDWQETVIQNVDANPQYLRDLNSLRREFCDVTAKIPPHVTSVDADYPIVNGEFVRIWKDFCLDAIELGPDGYGQTLCQALIELAYIDPLIYPKHDSIWLRELAEIYEEHLEVVDAAFEFMLSYDKLDMGDEPVLVIDDTWEDQYHNFVFVSGYAPLNAHEEFPERLKKIKERIVADPN